MFSALHLIDPGTASDALEMLATLIARSAGVEHRVLILGHRGVGERAVRAGVSPDLLSQAPSMGWADPTGWRAVRRHVGGATHIHAWGMRGVVAATVLNDYAGARISTFAVAPTDRQMRLLRAADARRPWAWIGSSSAVVRSLVTRGLPGGRVVRIRPGIAMGAASAGPAPRAVREALGILPDEGPVILIGGEPEHNARHDLAMWAGGIITQLYPRARLIHRAAEDEPSERFRYFGASLADNGRAGIVAEVSADVPWPVLARASDAFLFTPDGPCATHSVLWAMAAGTAVIATATPEVGELVEHGHSGLLARPRVPRSIAARLEEFMADSTLRWPLTDRARADVYAHFKPGFMAACFRAVYQQTAADPALTSALELPQPELTAADRFAGVVDLG